MKIFLSALAPVPVCELRPHYEVLSIARPLLSYYYISTTSFARGTFSFFVSMAVKEVGT